MSGRERARRAAERALVLALIGVAVWVVSIAVVAVVVLPSLP